MSVHHVSRSEEMRMRTSSSCCTTLTAMLQKHVSQEKSVDGHPNATAVSLKANLSNTEDGNIQRWLKTGGSVVTANAMTRTVATLRINIVRLVDLIFSLY